MHRLPVLIERALGQVQSSQTDEAQRFERDLADTRKAVTCTKGCSSCCYHPVRISILEGILLYRWLVKHNKWTPQLQNRLQTTGAQQFGTTYEVWLLGLTACPLLDQKTKLCSSYDARPLGCRVYVATSDPHYCHPHRLGPDTKILPRDEYLDSFKSKLDGLMREQKLNLRLLPIGLAILYGGKISREEMDLEGLEESLFENYSNKV